MTNKNTMSKGGYVFEHLWIGLFLIGLYRRTCFRTIDGYSYAQSKYILWAMVISAIVVGAGITMSKRRNYLSIVVTCLIPFELFTVIVYAPYYTKQLRITAVLTVVLLGAYLLLLLSGQYSARRPKGTQIKRRLANWALGGRTIGAFCFSWFLLFIFGAVFLGDPIMTPAVAAATRTSGTEYSIERNIDDIRKLDEDIWTDLEVREKLGVLQVVANIERDRLGISKELNVSADVLLDDDDDTYTCAHYDEARHRITVDLRYMETGTAEELLNTVCHECYHAYEYSMAELYGMLPEKYTSLYAVSRAGQYQAEFSDYSDGGDFDIYYDQVVEYDARKYARAVTREYLGALYVFSNSFEEEEK